MKPRGGEGQNGRLKCPMGFLVLVINSLPSFFVGSITVANSCNHKQLFSPTEYAEVLLIEMKQMYIYI